MTDIKPIIENDRDQRTYDYLVEKVGRENLLNACKNLAGNRKPYLSSIARYLNIKIPKSISTTPKKEAIKKLDHLLCIIKNNSNK